jgi:hypothetical protein
VVPLIAGAVMCGLYLMNWSAKAEQVKP